MKDGLNIADVGLVLHILTFASMTILFALWARSFADGDVRTAFGAWIGILFFSGILTGWHFKTGKGGDGK